MSRRRDPGCTPYSTTAHHARPGPGSASDVALASCCMPPLCPSPATLHTPDIITHVHQVTKETAWAICGLLGCCFSCPLALALMPQSFLQSPDWLMRDFHCGIMMLGLFKSMLPCQQAPE
jgi:hypothetical protein